MVHRRPNGQTRTTIVKEQWSSSPPPEERQKEAAVSNYDLGLSDVDIVPDINSPKFHRESSYSDVDFSNKYKTCPTSKMSHHHRHRRKNENGNSTGSGRNSPAAGGGNSSAGLISPCGERKGSGNGEKEAIVGMNNVKAGGQQTNGKSKVSKSPVKEKCAEPTAPRPIHRRSCLYIICICLLCVVLCGVCVQVAIHFYGQQIDRMLSCHRTRYTAVAYNIHGPMYHVCRAVKLLRQPRNFILG